MKEYQRLKYRFENFEKAFSLLSEAVEMSKTKELTSLEKEGVIQRFEITNELAIKVMSDYLKSEKIKFEKFPRNVIKKAFEYNLIDDGELWQKALETRNMTSHRYDEEHFNKAFKKIQDDFFELFSNFKERMSDLLDNLEG